MKSTFIKTLMLVLTASLSFTVNAASLSLAGTTSYNTNGFKGTISEVLNINDFLPGASEGFYVNKPNPTAMSAAHVQTALTAAGSSFLVTDFFKIDSPATNTLNTSSLGLSFTGFLMKYGTTTLIGLFSTPISSLDFLTHDGKDVSHIAYFNTSVSEVPLPAALWLFAPALMGFLGFRRRLNK
ncbi:MAG: VPLPA-CTERM sorting domain-containing protein [Gammaproteobacteria bacterium]|nr:VPLPA-CTERM sorting domain-containing protein [Gammaproteobacteria bacterium]